jgi:alkaline phosphatase D
MEQNDPSDRTDGAPGPAAGTRLGRRQVLVGAAGIAGGLAVASAWTPSAQAATTSTSLAGDPFLLGVASGDPLPDAVVIWTRLVADPLDAASMPARSVRVGWEMAIDARFSRVVRRGTAVARPEEAHSVHVDVRGLTPASDYFYRFRTDRFVSPVGRTRTTAAAGAALGALRFGVVNCQDFQNGYWPAYTHLADEDLDFVLHVGDYIYEYDPSSVFADRRHTTPQTPGLDQLRTLSDYRNRHAQYKGDPALQAAHAAFPWIVTWDDHETENNYAGLVDEIDDEGARHQDPAVFATQRDAAYRAYWEHQPLRRRYSPGSDSYRLFRRFDFGTLVRMHVLDTRQYRTDQPGGFSGDFGLTGAGTANVDGTMTGATQEHWLSKGLRESGARYNAITQQVMMNRTRFPNFTGPVPPVIANLDQWDGYAPQRTRILNSLVDDRIANPVVLSGDIHSTWFSDLKTDFDDLSSPTAAVEFVAPSISSSFPAAFDPVLKAVNPSLNPQVRYFDGLLHGYLRCDVDRRRWRTDVRNVTTIATRTAPVVTSTSWALEAGTQGLHQV